MLLRTAIRPTASAPTTFFHRTARPLLIAFGISAPFIAPRKVTYNDYSPSPTGTADFSYSHSRDAKVPLTKSGKLNPAAVRQISLGGVLGLGAGFLLSAFSRSLTLLLGLGIVVWQYAARKGYNIVPVDRMQKYVRGVNLRSAINDNAAFKISFGLVFALTAFGDF